MTTNYTKGDCYCLCEFLDSLILSRKHVIRAVAKQNGYDGGRTIELLKRLSKDVDDIIATEQSHRDDTDQMADIMTLTHIEGHEDE